MRLRFSRQALADIEDIYDYISKHSPRGVNSVAAQIHHTSGLLGQYPHLGRTTNIPGVYVISTPRYPYLIYHRILRDELVVIHVRHGRRDTLKEEELRED